MVLRTSLDKGVSPGEVLIQVRDSKEAVTYRTQLTKLGSNAGISSFRKKLKLRGTWRNCDGLVRFV